MRLHPAWVDLALVLAVLAGAGLLLIGASSLPPPRFEPMGSAALPRILAGLMALFALLIGIKAILQLRSQHAGMDGSEADLTMDSGTEADTGSNGPASAGERSSLLRGAGVLIALVFYILSLDVLQWPFIVVTTAFVTLTGTLLSYRPRQAAVQFLIFGLLFSTALYLIMTRFLYVDLG